MADCRKRIIVFKFVIKLVMFGLRGRPVLLVGIICVAAFRTTTKKKERDKERLLLILIFR